MLPSIKTGPSMPKGCNSRIAAEKSDLDSYCNALQLASLQYSINDQGTRICGRDCLEPFKSGIQPAYAIETVLCMTILGTR